jgi:hypothetical protein
MSSVVHARPGDRLEPWPLRHQQAAAGFANACSRLGVRFDVAGRVVVERGLLMRDLVAAGVADKGGELDALAGNSRVTRELADGLAAYLRSLASGNAEPVSTYRLLALPVRLRERLGHDEPTAYLDTAAIRAAISWERAAVIDGMTMTEWGAFATLRFRD